MLTRTYRTCFLHLAKSLHLVECLVQDPQVLEDLQGLDHHQLVVHLVLAMDLVTIMEQGALGLDTVVPVIPVVALDTMVQNVANMQVLVALVILEVDNMVVTLEVNSHQELRTLDTPLVQVVIRHVVLEVHRRAIRPQAILLVDRLGELRLVLTQGLEGVQEHHPPLWPQGPHLQDQTPHQARLQLIQLQPHHPRRPLHPQ